ELGRAIEPRLAALAGDRSAPRLTGWIFETGEWLDQAATRDWLAAQQQALPAAGREAGVGGIAAGLSEAGYHAALDRIRGYIEAGDCYQVNFTFPLTGQAWGDPLALYAKLREAQPVRYGAFIRHAGGAILSRSPELFLERSGRRLASRPMKGTAPRSSPASALIQSEKDRAENVMITDLIRNDMGRLAPPGGVKTPALCEVEGYPTVWQMTSTVVAEPVDAGLADIFAALFPCGSITGAPKIRAMQIIHQLETRPRGLYCGALGWIRPGGDFRLAVPIRTLELDSAGQARLGIGSGVVYDSDPAREWAECHLKARFLTALPSALRLIETLRCTPRATEPYPWLEDHLARLAASAAWLGFACDPDTVRKALLEAAATLEGLHRVRLTLGKQGDIQIQATPLPEAPPAAMPSVVISAQRVDSRDPLLRHKTTARTLYDDEIARVSAAGHFDALFFNERDELAEGGRSNVFLKLDGAWVTPPAAAGLLNGVARRRWLREARGMERSITREELLRAETICLGNAVRGIFEARLVKDEPADA
ncbi:MAG: aminodeoxychorismate synthase component I, partial [Zoogloea sp.]|nr:aminodeoxychorismate synthase component I [Zoogloea sp.]